MHNNQSVARLLTDSPGGNESFSNCLLSDKCFLLGKAPFNSLLDSIRSAQKTEFEKLCAEKDAEVHVQNYSTSLFFKIPNYIQNMNNMVSNLFSFTLFVPHSTQSFQWIRIFHPRSQRCGSVKIDPNQGQKLLLLLLVLRKTMEVETTWKKWTSLRS